MQTIDSVSSDFCPGALLQRKPPRDVGTLVDLCRWQVDRQGSNAAFSHLADNGRDEFHLTYEGLEQRIRAIAAVLSEHGSPGDRVLIVQQPGLDYVASLLASMYARMVAVPVYPPDLFRLRQTLPRLQAITGEADARIMLSSREILGNEVGPMWSLCRDAAIATDEIDSNWAAQWRPNSPRPHDLALLQYTSGSTGVPRGVALTHANLMANTEQGYHAFDVPDAVCVFWLPPYHDLGLIGGMLIPLYGGRHSVLMSPIAFVQEPIRWFRAITKYRGTTTASPNFGYEWCLRKIALEDCANIDLSSLQIAAVGAEPVRAATLRRFADRFGALGFSEKAFMPGYGLAEATLAVTNKPLGTAPVIRSFSREDLFSEPAHAVPVPNVHGVAAALDLVSSGRPVVNCNVRIVNPATFQAVPDGMVGEIWVQSPAVAQGYWKKTELSSATFAAQMRSAANASDGPDTPLTDACPSESFLRTGDLGFILDEELFVSGRLKEQIIIAGRNFFPHDIEAAIQGVHEAFKIDGGIAFSVESQTAEELIVVHEVLRPKRFDLTELTQIVLRTLLENFGLVPASIRLVAAASLPKTSSGKLRRLECRRQFIENELQILFAWDRQDVQNASSRVCEVQVGSVEKTLQTPAETGSIDQCDATQRKLIQIWCEVLGLDSADPQQHFLEVGGHSLLATQLLARIQQECGADVTLLDLFQHPTLGSLLAHIHTLVNQPASVPLQTPQLPAAFPSQLLSFEATEDRIDVGFPLTSAQHSFWLLHQLERYDAFLHVGLALQIQGDLNIASLVHCCQDLVRKHPSLQMQFATDAAGLPFQRPCSVDSQVICVPEVIVLGLRDHIAEFKQARLKTLCDSMMREPFQLNQQPLIRFALCQLESQQWQLVIVAHHIVCDGWSMWLLVQDLIASYQQVLWQSGEEDGRADVSRNGLALRMERWQRVIHDHAPASQQSLDRLRDYWANRLANVSTDQSLDLPTESGDRFSGEKSVRNKYGSERSSVVRSRLLAAEVEVLHKLCAELGVTPFAALFTLWRRVLVGYSGKDDLLLGVPIANRHFNGDQDVVASLIQTIPVRFNSADSKRSESFSRGEFAAEAQRFQAVWLTDLEHTDLALEQMFGAAGVARHDSSLLLRHLLLHQPNLPIDLNLGAAQVSDYQTDYSSLAAYESTLAVETHGNELQFNLIHNPNALAAEIATGMLECFITSLTELLRSAASESTRHVPLITLGSREQQRLKVLGAGRHIECDPPTLLEMLANHASSTPTKIAISDAYNSMTYGELEQLSDGFAVQLRANGVHLNSIVAVATKRSTHMVALLLGVWKAGGAYLPLDVRQPISRLHDILHDAQPVVLVSDESAPDTLPQGMSVTHLELNVLLNGRISATSVADLKQTRASERRDNSSYKDRLAYLIYTSGSTGKPKGVQVIQSAVANLLRSFAREPGLMAGESMLAATTITFDISVLELFLPLYVGGSCVLTEHSMTEDPECVVAALTDNSIDVIQSTPSGLRMLEALGWQPRPEQRIWCGGEALSPDLARRMLDYQVDLWNVYGPTETTVWSLVHRVAKDELPEVTIGHPIDNTDIFVLDECGCQVPIGVAGELCIAGRGLARGYWRRSDLTENRFVVPKNCLSDRVETITSRPNETVQSDLAVQSDRVRYYRTGDQVRWLPDGRLQFLGRNDRQVKLRGHRIELGEIEAAILAQSQIAQAAVMIHGSHDSDKQIIAFYSSKLGEVVEPGELRSRLQDVLPETMLPSQCIPLATIPLTVAGKIDYRSLPIDSCATRVMSSPQRTDDTTPPDTEMESLLHSIWCEVLKKETIGMHANFFGLGGHSLAAAQVLARVKQSLNQEVSLKEIYRYPTIATLAAWLADRASQVEPPFGVDDSDSAHEQSQHESTETLENEPLSFAEQRLWFVDQLEPNHPFYNLPLAAKLTGKFNRALFATAIQNCVARHETLRSTYRLVNGDPQRTIHKRFEVIPQYVDFASQTKINSSENAIQVRLQQAMVAVAREPFNLEHGPLLRVVVYQLGPDEHVVLLVMHHIVSDGWSMSVMLKELAEFYRAAENGDQPVLADLNLTYSQFAREQRRLAQTSNAEQALEFWKKTLQGSVETISLPTDFDRPAVQTFAGATLPLAIDPATSRAIQSLAADHQTTPFTVLLASYAALLSRYSGQHDFNIGTAIANRPRPELEALIGFFVGTLVLRMRIDNGLTFSQLIEGSQQVALDALSHADVPFESLVEKFASQRDRSHSPLFQVAFVFQNTPRDFQATPQLTIQPIAIDNGTSKYDLTLFLWEQDGQIQGHFEYRTSLFTAETIANLRDSFLELLSSAVVAPSTSVDSLAVVSRKRRNCIIQRSIARAKKVSDPRALHERIATQATLTPDAIAVIDDGRQWSYREFIDRVERLAAAMQVMGLRPDELAVVYMPRSVDQLACELAINCCGAAFVPVDTNMPPERLGAIVQETTPALVITLATHVEDLRTRCSESTVTSCDELLLLNATFNRIQVAPNQAAYVIFTSGSTGKPKGVVIEHHSICNFVETYCDVVEMHEGERVSHLLSPSFDGAFAETLPALSRGATLVIVPSDVSRDPARLTQFLDENHITFAVVTPVILNELEPSRLLTLKKIVSGGAKLTAEVSRKWLPYLRLFNGYGPTECTVGNAIHEISIDFGRTPSVGKPLPNTCFYVLDATRRLVPDGVVGEVYIGGECVGRGYWKQDALNNERFLEDPFIAERQEWTSVPDRPPRMYRTGDLGRWNGVGELEIVGRVDDQIKLRGFRIEPAEIAAVLDELPEVRCSAVIAWEDRDKGDQGTRLIAYFVPNEAVEGEQEHVDNWKVLFDESQVRSPLVLRPEDNFAGWQSVISGRGIDSLLMSEWAEETARRIDALAGKRILEVGCGTGLILLRLKSDFEHYTGVDLLPSAIDQLSRTVSQRNDLVDRVTLAVRTADQLDELPQGGFDTIVLNSVVQYFPSFSYLKRVLQSAERLLAPSGRIFLGDLRDLRLNAAFATEVETVRNEKQPITVGQLRQRIAQRLEHDEELQLDPRLFVQLADSLPRLATPSLRFKRGSYLNELNRYRFDAVLSFDSVSSTGDAEQSDYHANPWLDREGQPRKYQVLWACLNAADPNDDALKLEQLVDEWLTSGATLSEIVHLAALRGLAITTEDDPFEPASPERWTNHPLARRQSLNQISRIRAQLKERLPEYMVPAAFVAMDELPRTVQGKIDKAALPPPPAERPDWIGSFAAATDAFESQLVAIWEQLLNVSPIGIHDDFFQLGGHSMLAVRMVAEVEKRIGTPLPLAALFREPTIAQLAEQLRAPSVQGAASSLVRLNDQTHGRLLFCIHPAGGTVFCYRELGLLLEQDRPVYGLQAQGIDGRQPPHHSLIEMAQYYVEAIRSVANDQEIDILGWSLGGNIAYEVARQLIASGQKVHDVILLDSGLISADGELSDEDFLPLISALFPDQQHASLESLRKLSPQEQAAYFVEQAAKAGIVPADAEFMGAHVFSVFQANVKAVHQYEVQPLAHVLKLVRPLDQMKTGALFEDQNLGWEPWVKSVELSTVPGDHAGMLSGDAVKRLADQLR